MIIESNIRALVLLNLLDSLRKKDKMFGKPRILSLFPNSFNKFNKHEHSCKILYITIPDIIYFLALSSPNTLEAVILLYNHTRHYIFSHLILAKHSRSGDITL